MKLQKQLQTTTPLAGIFFVIEEFTNCGLFGLTDKREGISIQYQLIEHEKYDAKRTHFA